MAVSKTASASTLSSSGTHWIRLSGTIQEVLDALSKENISGGNLVYYTDDDTDAKALVCRQH